MKTASYYCFNCGTSLSGIKFLKLISGSNYDDIHREYVKIFLRSGLSSSLSSACRLPSDEIQDSIFELKPLVKAEWKNQLSDNAKKYLDDRLVTKSPFFNGGLYSWKNKDEKEYILIPWTINGIEAYF